MKLDIRLYNTKEGIRCFIKNIKSLNDNELEKIISFVRKREGGYFRYDLSEFGMRKKYSKEYLIKILKEYDISIDIIEPDFIQQRLIQIFSNLKLNYNIEYSKQTLGFGEYKNKTWQDVDENYLYYLIENFNDFKAEFAYYELKRRGIIFFDAPNDIDEYINFGKYSGKKWSEVDIEYLFWLTKNYDDDRMRLAKKEIQKRENEPKINNEKPKEDKTITFGKFRGKKWSEVDTNYLFWIINNMRQENIILQAREELKKRDGK